MPNKPPLSETHPELAREADGWDASAVTKGSHKKVPWKCKSGHTWRATIGSRASGVGCPYCARKIALPGESDLQTICPDLAKELVDEDGSKLLPGSNKKVKWKCSLGHIYTTQVVNRTGKKKAGCPYCSGKQLLKGFNDLATTHPDLAKTLVDLDPGSISKGSKKHGTWKCEHGHLFKAQIANRTTGYGCPYCSGNKVLVGFNDIGTTHPDLAIQLVDIDPSTISAGSRLIASWRCNLGHITKCQVALKHRVNCPICSGKQVLVGFNDLKTQFPEIASWAYGWDAQNVTPGAGKRLEWKCPDGHVFSRLVHHQVRFGTCPICSGHEVLAGFNDIATTHPDIARQLVDHDARKINAGSNKTVKWECEQGHHWRAKVASRCLRKTGCPSCAATGYNPGKKGYLYLLEKPETGLLQIGITNNLKVRISQHKSNGWEPVDARGPLQGYLAYEIERDILRYLDAMKIRRGKVAFRHKFEGYTESWFARELKVASIFELIQLVDDFNQNPVDD